MKNARLMSKGGMDHREGMWHQKYSLSRLEPTRQTYTVSCRDYVSAILRLSLDVAGLLSLVSGWRPQWMMLTVLWRVISLLWIFWSRSVHAGILDDNDYCFLVQIMPTFLFFYMRTLFVVESGTSFKVFRMNY